MITNEGALAALRPEWERSGARAVRDAFSIPGLAAVLVAPIRHRAPRVAVLRDDGRLVGLLPLYILDEGSERKLLPLGAGITDYFDALLEPGLPPGAADALLRAALAATSEDGITACDLTDIPPDAALRGLHPPSGWRMARTELDPCPVLTIPESAADLEPPFRRDLRKLRMNRHRAERIGGWRIESATEETLPGLLEDMFHLHGTRWFGWGRRACSRTRACARFTGSPPLLCSVSVCCGCRCCGSAIVRRRPATPCLPEPTGSCSISAASTRHSTSRAREPSCWARWSRRRLAKAGANCISCAAAKTTNTPGAASTE